jgi:hypothetical protein
LARLAFAGKIVKSPAAVGMDCAVAGKALPAADHGVRDAKSPRLFGREMLDPDYRDFNPPKPLQGNHPAMSGQDLVVAIDQNRDEVAERFDGVGNLPDLPSAMLLWISRVGFELADRQPLDLQASRNILCHLSLLDRTPRRGARQETNARRSRKPVSAN